MSMLCDRDKLWDWVSRLLEGELERELTPSLLWLPNATPAKAKDHYFDSSIFLFESGIGFILWDWPLIFPPEKINFIQVFSKKKTHLLWLTYIFVNTVHTGCVEENIHSTYINMQTGKWQILTNSGNYHWTYKPSKEALYSNNTKYQQNYQKKSRELSLYPYIASWCIFKSSATKHNFSLCAAGLQQCPSNRDTVGQKLLPFLLMPLACMTGFCCFDIKITNIKVPFSILLKL